MLCRQRAVVVPVLARTPPVAQLLAELLPVRRLRWLRMAELLAEFGRAMRPSIAVWLVATSSLLPSSPHPPRPSPPPPPSSSPPHLPSSRHPPQLSPRPPPSWRRRPPPSWKRRAPSSWATLQSRAPVPVPVQVLAPPLAARAAGSDQQSRSSSIDLRQTAHDAYAAPAG